MVRRKAYPLRKCKDGCPPIKREPIKREPIKREPISRTPKSRTGDEGAEPEGMEQRYLALVYRIKSGMSKAEVATILGRPPVR